MSKKIFTEQEILELSKNKYVKNVTAKGITYTNEFKLQFIAEYENGKTSRAIFEDAGFDVNIIGIKRIDSASLRWRKAYNDKGILGLEDTRTLNSGRTLNRELTIEEIIAKKDAEIEYLKAELELIKKLELQERQVINKKIPASKIFTVSPYLCRYRISHPSDIFRQVPHGLKYHIHCLSSLLYSSLLHRQSHGHALKSFADLLLYQA